MEHPDFPKFLKTFSFVHGFPQNTTHFRILEPQEEGRMDYFSAVPGRGAAD